MNQFKQPENHESYGLIQFASNDIGTETTLFGSSVPNVSTMRLRIMPGRIINAGTRNEAYIETGEASFIEVEMSHEQYSKAISKVNGEPTPVTIRRVGNKQIEGIPFKDKMSTFVEDFKNEMIKITERLSKLTLQTKEILESSKPVNKTERKEILKEIQTLESQIRNDIPFILSLQVDHINNAKNEIEQQINAKKINDIQLLGMETLKKVMETNKELFLDLEKPKEIGENK